MKNFKDLISRIILKGSENEDRTGVGTCSIFGTFLEWDLEHVFPATTLKRLAWKAVVSELQWFLSGSTNVNTLRNLLHGTGSTKRTIWDDNYDNQAKALGYTGGELGPVYGAQFHRSRQLYKFIEGLKHNPQSRRHIISLWSPEDIDDMALPPCHGLVIQANVRGDKLDIQWYQRSVDTFLGLPFNIASYALFTHVIASIVGLRPGKLSFCGGDTHIYSNHLEACRELLSRDCRPLPTLQIPKFESILDFVSCDLDDIKLINYNPHPSIVAPMAV